MIIKLDKRFQTRVKGIFGKYEFEVGILQDGPHKLAKRGKRGLHGTDVITQYAGGPRRKVQAKDSGVSISEVSKAFRERVGINYLTAPFEKAKHESGAEFSFSSGSSDIRKFLNEFFKLAFGRSERRRAENLLQAVVRNPILRGDYGHNSPLTKAIKGFDRFGIDTAQLFKAIVAHCTIKGT